MSLSRTASVLVSFSAALAIAPAGLADDPVVPSAQTHVAGDANNRIPFGSVIASRYQQIYGAPDLTALGGSGIDAIAFL
ncbi:MAG: hypothetical protein GY711_09440 [bacterium]|nr:hypothetical protein [bacterium]